MTEGVIIALLSLFGTLIGTFAGIITSGKLTNYRLQELEKKVEKHNNLIERTYTLEKRETVNEEKLKALVTRIEHIERTTQAKQLN